jgi:hypothetical protein
MVLSLDPFCEMRMVAGHIASTGQGSYEGHQYADLFVRLAPCGLSSLNVLKSKYDDFNEAVCVTVNIGQK